MSNRDSFRLVTLQSAAAATGNGTALQTAGFGSARLQVTGTFVGTLTFEGTIDGTTWVALEGVNTSGARVTTATATGLFLFSVAGLMAIRARVSAYTSGSITVLGMPIRDAIQALITAALPANSGVDIGDVDVTSVVPGTSATSLGKAIDTAAGATDTGVAPLALRDDALSGLTPAEGDYAPLRVDANGALWTRDDVLEAVVSGSEIQADIVAIGAGATLIGDVGLAARASGGGTSLATGAISDTVTDIKASAGQLYALILKNTTGAAAYFQVFNALAANVTLGTTTPTWSIGLAASESKVVVLPVPAVFGTAISCAGTTTRTGLTAAVIDMNALYA